MLAVDWKMLGLGGGNGDVVSNRERLCLAGCAARTHIQLQSESVWLATRLTVTEGNARHLATHFAPVILPQNFG
jgi:hypothetical protein